MENIKISGNLLKIHRAEKLNSHKKKKMNELNIVGLRKNRFMFTRNIDR